MVADDFQLHMELGQEYCQLAGSCIQQWLSMESLAWWY